LLSGALAVKISLSSNAIPKYWRKIPLSIPGRMSFTSFICASALKKHRLKIPAIDNSLKHIITYLSVQVQKTLMAKDPNGLSLRFQKSLMLFEIIRVIQKMVAA